VSAPQEPPKSGPVFFSVTVCLRAGQWSVLRRYSEFDALKTALQQQEVVLTVELPGKLPPPGYDIAALNKRAVGIEKWAAAVLNSPDALEHPAVLTFFALHQAPPESVAGSNGVKEEPEAPSAPPSAEPKEEEEEEFGCVDPRRELRAWEQLGFVDPTRELQEYMHAVRKARLSSNNDPLAGAQDWLAMLLAEESGNGTEARQATTTSVRSVPTEDPSNFARGLLDAFGSVAAGIAGGAAALVTYPVVGATVVYPVIAALTMPVVGAVVQVVTRATEGPSAMGSWLDHGMWSRFHGANPKADKAKAVLDDLPHIDGTPSFDDQGQFFRRRRRSQRARIGPVMN